MDLIHDTRSNTLVAGTFGRGLWRAKVAGPPPVLRADYRFQHSLASSVGSPPALTKLGPAANTFGTETVDGSARTVLQFPAGNGVQLATAGTVVPHDAYTIVALLRLRTVAAFERLVDFKHGTSDGGLYDFNGNLVFSPSATGSGAPLKAGKYAQVALTRDAAGVVTGYVNGTQTFSFTDAGDDGVVDAQDVLRFFRDDDELPGENSAGAVARIRLWDGPLSSAQVAALDRGG